MVKTEKMITRNIKSKVFLRQQKKTKKTQNRLKKSYLVFCLIFISSGVTKLGKKKPLFKQEQHQHLFHSSSFLFVVHATAAYVLLQKLIGI